MDAYGLRTVLNQFEQVLEERGYDAVLEGARALATPPEEQIPEDDEPKEASKADASDDQLSADDSAARLALLCDLVEVSLTADAEILQHLEAFRDTDIMEDMRAVEYGFVELSIPRDYPTDSRAEEIDLPLSSVPHTQPDSEAILADIRTLRETLDLPTRPDLHHVWNRPEDAR